MIERLHLQPLLILAAALVLAACATPGADAPGSARPGAAAPAGPATAPVASSAECLAAKLSPSEPFLASAIPSDLLQKRQNGAVAVRYDVVAGKAANLSIAASQPEGLYDSYVLQHAQRYRDAGGKTVRGCVMTVDIKF